MNKASSTIMTGPPKNADCAALAAYIRAQIAVGRRATVNIARAVAQAKDDLFAERYHEWLEWAETEFGYAKRTCDRLARVGTFLLTSSAQHVDIMAGLDLDKIEQLSRLPGGHLSMILHRHCNDIAAMPRDDFRELVRKYLDAAQGQLPPPTPPKTRTTRSPLDRLRKYDPNTLDPVDEAAHVQVRLSRLVDALEAHHTTDPQFVAAATTSLRQIIDVCTAKLEALPHAG